MLVNSVSYTSSCLNFKTSSQRGFKIWARLAKQNMRSTPVMLSLFVSTQGDYLWQQREEGFKAVEETQKQGIIKPSVSSWALPVVLVKKKRWLDKVLCGLPQTE